MRRRQQPVPEEGGNAMFLQAIYGPTDDPESMSRIHNRWVSDLMPGAAGFLGSTSGLTPDGIQVTLARFESRDAAEANSARPEQGQWWAEAEKCYSGPVTFHDCDEVDVIEGDDNDSAGFVQIMIGRVTDRELLRRIEDEHLDALLDARPEILGLVRGYFAGDHTVEAAYFTSEAEARRGESTELPGELAQAFAQLQNVSQVDRFLDLPDPVLITP